MASPAQALPVPAAGLRASGLFRADMALRLARCPPRTLRGRAPCIR